MKTGLLVSLLLAGAIILISSCRSTGPSPGQFRTNHGAHAAAMGKEPRPYYPPAAPHPHFKMRRY